MKKVFIILLIAVFALFSLGVVKDQILKAVITGVTSQITGSAVKIGGFSLSLIGQKVRIKDFRIYNPKGFPKEDVLIDIPEVSVNYDMLALLGGKLHIPKLVVNLKELVVIKNEKGVLNVDSLKFAQKEEEPAKKEEKKKEDKPKKKSKPLAMQIDYMKLTIGHVVMKDYSKMTNGEPSVQAYDIGVDKEYKNITSAQQLATLITVAAMKGTAIKGAGIYGAASVLGVAFLPAGVASALIGKDSGSAEFSSAPEKVYQAALELLTAKGKSVKGNPEGLSMKANVEGSTVVVKIAPEGGKTTVTISARKFMLPQPETAEGILYQLKEKLK